jgi:hypothetical protein
MCIRPPPKLLAEGIVHRSLFFNPAVLSPFRFPFYSLVRSGDRLVEPLSTRSRPISRDDLISVDTPLPSPYLFPSLS